MVDEERELTEAEEFVLRRSYRTVIEQIRQHEPNPCIAIRQVGPIELGVLAIEVCGRSAGHDRYHQAGWTTHGRKWD